MMIAAAAEACLLPLHSAKYLTNGCKAEYIVCVAREAMSDYLFFSNIGLYFFLNTFALSCHNLCNVPRRFCSSKFFCEKFLD